MTGCLFGTKFDFSHNQQRRTQLSSTSPSKFRLKMDHEEQQLSSGGPVWEALQSILENQRILKEQNEHLRNENQELRKSLTPIQHEMIPRRRRRSKVHVPLELAVSPIHTTNSDLT